MSPDRPTMAHEAQSSVDLSISSEGPKKKLRLRAPSAYDVVSIILALALARACGFNAMELGHALLFGVP